MTNQHASFHLYHTAGDAIAALKRRLVEAESSIEFETFYILPDDIGREILDILLKKAREGIKVRLLCDAMGSLSLASSLYIKELHKAGSSIKFFNTILPFSKARKALWYLRNHRRTIIIDGKILFVGSVCIGEPARDWIETVIELRHSDSIAQARAVFNKTWKKSSRRTFRIGNAAEISTDAFSYITQAPMQKQRHLYDLLLRKIKEARTSIMLAAPYLIPDRRLFRALRKAAKRGIRITLICPRKTDFLTADLARDSFVHTMLRLKIETYFFPMMIHSKVAIFDAESDSAASAIIGTLNLDNISLRYNYECAIYSDDRNCVSELHAHMTSLIHRHPESRLTIRAWEKRGLSRKILEFLMLPFRKLL